MDGVSIISVMNTKAKDYFDVKVFVADKWYDATEGKMRNLVIDPNAKGNHNTLFKLRNLYRKMGFRHTFVHKVLFEEYDCSGYFVLRNRCNF